MHTASDSGYMVRSVRRIQIHIEEALDEAAEAEAARGGQSKAAIIRQAWAHEVQLR